MVQIGRKQKKKQRDHPRLLIVTCWLLACMTMVVIIAEMGTVLDMSWDHQQQNQQNPLSRVNKTSISSSTVVGVVAESTISAESAPSSTKSDFSYRAPLMYGTKSGKEQTAQLVKDAILVGFRHIVTGGHHQSHNETGVGEGWKQAMNELRGGTISRKDLYLQTCFVPWDGNDFKRQATDPREKPSTIEEQVHLSIETSLQNLQTDYIDAVLFHNFRAQLYPYEQMIRAWKILEEYVAKGIIKHLGLTSIHDSTYLEKVMTTNETKIKPTIVQNRFHSNRGYDVNMQETFKNYELQIQRFWLLNGSSGGGVKNKDMAEKKKITPQQLMLGFVMSLHRNTCLVGTHKRLHMIQDIQISKCYQTIFDSNHKEEQKEYAKKLGMKINNWEYYDDYASDRNLYGQQQQKLCDEV